jgi:FtsH-binding integral membrane protein
MVAWLLGLAAAWTGLIAAVHVVAGGREIARPLREADALPAVQRAVALMCWHFTSVGLVALAAGFAWSAATQQTAAAAVATAVSAAFAVVGLVMARRLSVPLSAAPQGLLFLPGALLGGLALVL